MSPFNFRQSPRIIFAVAGKDIHEPLKNRILLMIVTSVMLLMLTGPVFSYLINRNQPMLVMDASTDPELVQALESREDMRLVLVETQALMEATILQPPQAITGVVVPASPDEASNTDTILEGFTAHWVSESRMNERIAFFEQVLGEAIGGPVRIDMEGNHLYPSLENADQFTMIGMSLTTMLILMGLALVPYLFIEEKESHTIDALLVSPAKLWQLVAGKLLAGAVFCLAAAAVVLIFNFRIVVYWDLMLVTVLLGTAFAVSLGLLMGMLFDNAASMGLWSGLLTILLMIAPLIQTMGAGKLPDGVLTVLSWLPSSAIYGLSVLSLLGEVPLQQVWYGMLLLVVSTLLLCLLVFWRMRRLDR